MVVAEGGIVLITQKWWVGYSFVNKPMCGPYGPSPLYIVGIHGVLRSMYLLILEGIEDMQQVR